MKNCVILLHLLSATAWARPPAEVVSDAFEYDRRHGMNKTIRDRANCFTPGFLGIFERALALKPGSAAFVDMDYFYCTQDGGMQFSVVKTEVTGKEGAVYLKTWQGAYRGAPSQKQPAQPTVKVHLADVGQGYQIKDIEHLPHRGAKGFSTREDFKLLLQGRWPDR
jgi:hypothetical protein